MQCFLIYMSEEGIEISCVAQKPQRQSRRHESPSPIDRIGRFARINNAGRKLDKPPTMNHPYPEANTRASPEGHYPT